MMADQIMGVASDEARATPERSQQAVSALRGGIANAKRASLTVYPKPIPARTVLTSVGLTDQQAEDALRALAEAGYGVAPRHPTNGMLAAYIEATSPPRHHEAVITAISKARARWAAMLAQGHAMAMSRKFIPTEPEEEDADGPTGCGDDLLPGSASDWRRAAQAMSAREGQGNPDD